VSQGMDSKVSALTHPNLVVTKTQGGVEKVRKVFKVGGWAPPSNIGVHNPTINNVARGVLERVFLC